MHWLSDNSNEGKRRLMSLSSGVALLLMGLRQRSLAGAIISAVGGRAAYRALKKHPPSSPGPGSFDRSDSTGAAAGDGSRAVHIANKGLAEVNTNSAEIATRAVRTEEGRQAAVFDEKNHHPQAEGNAISWKQLLLNRANLWAILKETISSWSADRVPSLGAALAYYTMFSVAPLLVIAIAVVGVVFGTEAAQSSIMQEIAGVMGNNGVQAIQTMLQSAHKPGVGTIAGIFGVIALLLGASGVFGELQDSLKAIWHVPSTHEGLWQKLKYRFVSYGMVIR